MTQEIFLTEVQSVLASSTDQFLPCTGVFLLANIVGRSPVPWGVR